MRKGDMDMEKPPVMNAAMRKFGEQWCSGWCSAVVGMASDRDAVYNEMRAATCAGLKAAGL